MLTGEELGHVLEATGDYRPLFTFAANTGARLGEVLGLTWRDVDLEDGTASIGYQLDRRGKRVPLKTARSRRTIELPGSLMRVLREHNCARRTRRRTPTCSARAAGARSITATSPAACLLVR